MYNDVPQQVKKYLKNSTNKERKKKWLLTTFVFHSFSRRIEKQHFDQTL